MNLTNIQKVKIYCIKHEHAKFITSCFGYIHCGRCSQQIGDTLAGVFDVKGYVFVSHLKEKCGTCTEDIKKLSHTDQLIANRLAEDLSQEDAIKGIDFE